MPKFPTKNVPKWDMFDHGVNNAMGTKSCATWMRQSHNEVSNPHLILNILTSSSPHPHLILSQTEGNRSYQKLEMQDTYHGQPHGMFSADECFGGRDLNRGALLWSLLPHFPTLPPCFWAHFSAKNG